MIDYIIKIALKNRLLVILAFFTVIILGVFQYKNLPTDAFPDVSPIMVPIFAEGHGMAPEEMERLITFPIESAMNGLPDVEFTKSTSAFGMAVIYIYFKDGVDIYFARQIVSERLASVTSELPKMDSLPKLGPISTGLGEAYMYYLTLDENVDTEGKDPVTYLREINDWVVKFQLQTVPGVTEILSMGGHVLQYQIELNPYALNKYKITLEDVVGAVHRNNRNAGGQFFVLGAEEYLVRGIGLYETLEEIRNTQIKVVDGRPVLMKDIADVDFGNEIRRGVVTINGGQEIVAGIVMKLWGENTSKVIEKLKIKFPEIQASLPKGVHIKPYYDQSTLVKSSTNTVKEALMMGALLVLITLFLFLGNIRAALIVAVALPVCALTAVLCMGLTGLSANLMTFGGIAIAIGMLGDGAIVMVENLYRHISKKELHKELHFLTIIEKSASEVAPPIVFSIVIIIIVFLPIFCLQGVEGKMFSPLAFTICFALLGSLIFAIVVAPVMASFLLEKTEGHKEFFLIKVLKKFYHPLLQITLKFKKSVLVCAILGFFGTLLLVPFLGTEFIPTLEEGNIQINITLAPSTSLIKVAEIIAKLEKEVLKHHEVEQVVTKIGRPEAGSHPHPVNFANMQLKLKPLSEWKDHKTKLKFIDTLNKELSVYPGISLNFTQPIQNLFDELLSGVRTQLALKLYGEDLDVLRSKSEEIKEVIEGVPGLVDLATEKSFGQPQVQVIANREACARYGVDVNEILEAVELAIGGEVIDQLYLKMRRFGIFIRYQEPYRTDTEVIGNILVQSNEGYQVPLSQVADIKKIIGPIQINREKNQRLWTIQANVRGRDIGSVVADIKARINEKITLPPGYWLEYGGQFKNQQRAMKRLAIIVPIAFLLIFLMLFMSLGNFRNSLLIFINIPFALIGGILGLFLTGEFLSVPASIGFIALFGIAVQNGLVLVTCINQLRDEGMNMDKAIMAGSLMRLRPVLMTAITTILGLVPLLLSTGIGSEVQRPLAVVVVFGLLSSTLLTLFIIPAFYEWFSVNITQEEI